VTVADFDAVARSDPNERFDREDRVLFHDMQQPLSALQLVLGALSQRHGFGPVTHRLVEIAAAQTDVLQAMLTQRLRSSSPARIPLCPAPAVADRDISWAGSDHTAIDDVVRSVIQPLQATTSGRIGYFALDRPWVRVDPLALRRLVANVVTNAVEATEPDGTVQIGLRKTAAGVELVVDDSGAGPGHKPAGHGVGLVSSMAAVVNANGELAFLRSPLGGVRIRVVLPAAGT
jgi:signal transduction histidine kinase